MPARVRCPRWTAYAAAIAVLLTLSGCNGLYLGDNPAPDVKKERGPLTVPPPPAADPPKR